MIKLNLMDYINKGSGYKFQFKNDMLILELDDCDMLWPWFYDAETGTLTFEDESIELTELFQNIGDKGIQYKLNLRTFMLDVGAILNYMQDPNKIIDNNPPSIFRIW